MRTSADTEESWRCRVDEARGKVLGVARQAEETAEAFGTRVENTFAAATQKVRQTVHGLKDDAAAAADEVGGAVRRVTDSLAQGGDAAQRTVSDLLGSIGSNPALLGALGFAGGALLGALIPLSEAEAAALGGIARQARTAATDLAQETVDTGGKAAKRALDAGLDSARAHGLSGDSTVKDVLDSVRSGDIVETAGGVAEDALQAGAEVIRGGTPRSAGGGGSPSLERGHD